MRQVILVSAAWCTACHAMMPWWNDLRANDSNAVPMILDIEQDSDMLEKYSICSLPTVLFLEDDKVILQTEGAKTKHQIVELIKKLWELR